MQWLGVGATLRASLAFFNTVEEIDALVRALHKARKLLA
jgi:cysteine desulfurase/selenocysteine lyase